MKLFETLETRRLMTAVTDMTQLALEYPVHSGATNLFLNFDGGKVNDPQAGGATTVSSFVPPKSEDRAQAIQEILYRASEIFAPFNVRVSVLTGAGQYAKTGGATTIFIGDQPAHVDSNGHNVSYDSTAFASCDTPSLPKGTGHAPNSDAYDLAFVDPVSYDGTGNNTTDSDLGIARGIAHEAGHTFGLGHVLSAPTADVMSYNYSNQYFSNTSLTLTDLNNPGNGSLVNDPNCVPTIASGQMRTQNSFTYLNATLGSRDLSNDPYPCCLADSSAVDPSYLPTLGVMASLSTATTTSGTLHTGEYDAYNFTLRSSRLSSIAAINSKYTINVHASGALSPEVMVYDSTGTNLVTSFAGTSGQFVPMANTNYKIVVGSYGGNSSGTYAVSFAPVALASQTPAATSSPALSTMFSSTPVASDLFQLVA